MEIDKIKKKYCANDKVQLMFSNPRQIILSKDGYLYLREQGITIHRYLTDPVRKKMPYKNKPSSRDHATHLFEYDKIYAKFTAYRDMCARFPLEDLYSLTFLYFIRAENGEAFCAEFDLEDFKAEKETSQILSKAGLEKFLYDLDGVDAKCIFEYPVGIRYAKHKRESTVITNDSFLNLSDEGIIDSYNRENESLLYLIIDEKEQAKEMKANKSLHVYSIEDIKDFVLTYHGFNNCYSPMLLVINGNEMYVYDFSITFKEKDCFEVKSKKRKIVLNHNDILRNANDCKYTHDPSFSY